MSIALRQSQMDIFDFISLFSWQKPWRYFTRRVLWRVVLPPFSLALHCAGSVLAVKGPLRRVPRPGRLRADPKGGLFTREKGGCRSASDFVSHLIAFDSHRWRCAQKDTAGWIFGPCFRAEREPFGHTSRLEPQPRGAVTRRAVAQRRSRASGLTRLSAEAISDSAWTGLQNWPHSVSRRETRIVRSLFVRDSVTALDWTVKASLTFPYKERV